MLDNRLLRTKRLVNKRAFFAISASDLGQKRVLRVRLAFSKRLEGSNSFDTPRPDRNAVQGTGVILMAPVAQTLHVEDVLAVFDDNDILPSLVILEADRAGRVESEHLRASQVLECIVLKTAACLQVRCGCAVVLTSRIKPWYFFLAEYEILVAGGDFIHPCFVLSEKSKLLLQSIL